MKDHSHKKILFKYHSNVLDEIVVETMWAKIVDESRGVYKLDSIPFYGASIATDDEFLAEFDESEQQLIYRKTLNYSGNSIVLVNISEEGLDKEVLREEFKKMHCASEGLNDTYFSMEIPKSTNYKLIKEKLEKYEREGAIYYAEPCLSTKHRKDLVPNV